MIVYLHERKSEVLVLPSDHESTQDDGIDRITWLRAAGYSYRWRNNHIAKHFKEHKAVVKERSTNRLFTN